MEHFAWTVALTRMISAVFRRGGDVSFVVEELKAVDGEAGGPPLSLGLGAGLVQPLRRLPVELSEAIRESLEGSSPSDDTVTRIIS